MFQNEQTEFGKGKKIEYGLYKDPNPLASIMGYANVNSDRNSFPQHKQDKIDLAAFRGEMKKHMVIDENSTPEDIARRDIEMEIQKLELQLQFLENERATERISIKMKKAKSL